ncbi:MAG: hypothetical protein RL380_1103 [Verrucomicrobiota bacterium]
MKKICLLLATGSLAVAAESNSYLTRVILATNRVEIKTVGALRLVLANGMPAHATGEFPNAHNPNRLAPQDYTFKMPLHPQPAANSTPANGAWFGVALNGVPFEPGTAEFWQGRREWTFEAESGAVNLGLDEHHAHVQPNGSYHYHGLPTGLLKQLGTQTNRMTLVGWAADGFPLYTPYGHAVATNVTSAVRKLTSSWQLKKGERPADAPEGKYNGAFSADYEFVPGSGDLDECNGRTGVTPEFTNGTYYYVITAEFPQLARAWRGQPDESFFKRRPLPQLGRPGTTEYPREHPLRPDRRRPLAPPPGLPPS